MCAAEISARSFHEGTKHPNGNLLDPRHRFDPRRRPPLVKRYLEAEVVDLPAVEAELEPAALDAIARSEPFDTRYSFEPTTVARLLHYSAGVTKRLRAGPGRRMPFRAASCTGALYHVELYLACTDLPQLEAGLYAYQPEAHQLVRLREGDAREELAAAAGDGQPVHQAPLTLVFTSAYWRNAFKYQARAYRHVFWDGGTVLANSLAMAASLGWQTRVQLAFADDEVERVLGIENEPELPICLLPLGEGAPPQEGTAGELQATSELPSGYRRKWPAIVAAQRATSLNSAQAAERWLQAARSRSKPDGAGDGESIALPAPDRVPTDRIERVIRRRGSSRRFERRPIEAEALTTILERSLGAVASDAAPDDGLGLAQPYLLVNAVQGIDPGVYRYDRQDDRLELVRQGLSRREAGELALGQTLGADAAVNLYFVATWDQILAAGERGYRLAQLEGGVLGGRVYLAAYALGLGATGLTFFDDAVAQALAREPQETAVLFLVAVGHPG